MAARPMVEAIEGISNENVSRGDGQTKRSGGQRRTITNYVGAYCIPKGKITRDPNEQIDEACNTYASSHDGSGACTRIIGNFIQDRKHLRVVSRLERHP